MTRITTQAQNPEVLHVIPYNSFILLYRFCWFILNVFLFEWKWKYWVFLSSFKRKKKRHFCFGLCDTNFMLAVSGSKVKSTKEKPGDIYRQTARNGNYMSHPDVVNSKDSNLKEQGRGTFSSATWTLMSFSANMLANIFWLKCEGSVYLKSCLHPAVTLLALFWCRADFIMKSSCWKRDCCWLENRSDKRLRGTIEILSSSLTIANSESSEVIIFNV